MPGIGRREVLAGATIIGFAGRRALAATKDTLVLGLENFPPNLKPYEHTGSASGTVKLLTHRGLLSHKPTGELEPELAESWHIENGTDYIFKLRSNAKFHDGTAVTAEDVIYSFGIIQKEASARLGATMKLVESMTAQDASTVRLRLAKPTAPFAEALANLNCGVYSAKAHQADANNFVGAGPYVIVSQERGSTIMLDAFKGFYKPGLPKIPHIKTITYTDDSLRATALSSGDADIIEDAPWHNLDGFQQNPRLSVQSVNGAFMFVSLNVSQGPLANAKVRQAIAFAMNRDNVLKAAFGGKGAPLYGLPIPAESALYTADTANLWKDDKARAKQLLVEAGYPSGFDITLLTTTSPTIHSDTSVVMQQSLKDVGINVTLQPTDWTTRVARGNKGQYEMGMNGTAPDYNDPDALSTLLGSGPATYQRSAGFKSEKIDNLFARGRNELNVTKRREIYAELSRAVFEETPQIFLTWRAQAFAMQKSIQNFHNMPGFLTFHSGQTLEDVTFASGA